MAWPVKVLWISCVGERGGAEVYMLNLLRRLDRTRFMPAVAMLRPGPLERDVQELGVPVHSLASHRMRQIFSVGRAIQTLARLIHEHGYHLVHSNGFRAHVYGGLAAWRTGTREIWTVHTVEQPGFSTRAILRIPTTQVVANCHRTADYFVAQGCPTSLIWPGVDLEQLEYRAPRAALEAKYHLPPGSRWILQGTRLQRYKGHEFLLRALAALPPALAHVHAVIIGGTLFGMEADYPAELRALAGQLGIASRVHFTGFIDDHRELYGFQAAADLVVHPALDEDFGLIVAECQALGIPALAFASPGPMAIIQEGETGCLVPIGDQVALSAALADMLHDPERLRQWGLAARERSRRRFSAVNLAAQLERLYLAALDERMGGSNAERKAIP